MSDAPDPTTPDEPSALEVWRGLDARERRGPDLPGRNEWRRCANALAELFTRDAPPLKADGAWCINCFVPFGADAVRYYFGAHDVGPFCEGCDREIKLHTLFRGETTSRQ